MDPLVRTLIQNLNELQLQPGATYEEAKKRYKNLIVLNHPDKHQPGTAAYALAEAETKRINAAFAFITTYKDLLPSLGFHAGAGRPGNAPPPPNPPPGNPGGGGASAPGQPPPPGTKSPSPPVIARFTGSGAKGMWRVAAVVLCTTLFVAFMVVREERSPARRPEPQAAREEKAPEPPPPPPRPSIWQPVIQDGRLPIAEIASLVGTSARAVDAAFRNTDYREVDINLDGKNEVLITNIEGTCRREGCPVYLIQSYRGRLRDLLPNNYGWTSVTVVNHMTHGARDIIVTKSDWGEAQRTDTTPSERECHRLVWGRRGGPYVTLETDPSPEVCFAAEKTAWNIPVGRVRGVQTR